MENSSRLLSFSRGVIIMVIGSIGLFMVAEFILKLVRVTSFSRKNSIGIFKCKPIYKC